MAGDRAGQDRTLVRASDLSAWAYCQRAWWLANVQGVPHQSPEQMERGRVVHAEHGREVARAARLQRIGLAIMVTAALIAVLALLAALFT